MSTSIGFYFFDLNDCDSASGYWDQARTAAQDAENTELSIYALCEMSHAAYWQGDAQTAIDTAAAARNLLGKTDDPLMQVCVSDKAAQGYALDGQQEACMAECEKAQEALESATHAPTGSPAYWYHEGQLASERSGCLLQLGKPQDAATSANNGLALFDDSFVNSRAFCTLFLGNAHLQSDEVDEAARVVGDAAGLAAQTRSARLAKELRTTRARMEPWQSTLAVKALDDQLATYGLATSSAT
jgi:ATP/maltotriose-dependent transcriptional regulator MalT